MKQHSTRPLRFSLSLAVRLCANVEGFANIPVHRFAKGQTSMTQPSLETTTTTTTQLNMYLDLDGKTGSAVAGPTNSRGNTNKKHPQDEPPKQQDLVLSPDTRKLGNLVVPSLGIGTISWSSDKLFSLENQELQTLVDAARASNAAFFDTAERYGSHFKTAVGLGYGETERMIRKLLDQSEIATQQEQQLAPVIATKFTPLPWRTTVESVVEACEESRRRLGVDQIDLYQLHMPDIVQPLKLLGFKEQSKDEIYWQGLVECYQRGLVKNVGVSNYGPSRLQKCQEVLAKYNVPLASNQIAYSLIGRHNGAQETVDYCNQEGIQVLAFYPLAMGLLTGKYNPAKDSTRGFNPLTQTNGKTLLEEYDLKNYAKEGGLASLLAVMQEIADAHSNSNGTTSTITLAQVALNYIICKGVIPIPGARNTAQVLDNLGAMGWRLTSQEVERLEIAANAASSHGTTDGLGGFDGAGFKRTSEKFVGYGVEKWRLD